ncbi:MAG: zinc ribbon domain-containing protein [Thermodesulfobacteriota bacterium]
MPIYEYRCRSCRRRVQVLTLRASEQPDAVCDKCGSRELDRLMSRFAVARSEESRLDALGDPSQLSGLDENDPKSVARWMRKMGKELGDDVGGPEFDAMVDELEAGGDLTDDAGDAGQDGDAGGAADAGGGDDASDS